MSYIYHLMYCSTASHLDIIYSTVVPFGSRCCAFSQPPEPLSTPEAETPPRCRSWKCCSTVVITIVVERVESGRNEEILCLIILVACFSDFGIENVFFEIMMRSEAEVPLSGAPSFFTKVNLGSWHIRDFWKMWSPSPQIDGNPYLKFNSGSSSSLEKYGKIMSLHYGDHAAAIQVLGSSPHSLGCPGAGRGWWWNWEAVGQLGDDSFFPSKKRRFYGMKNVELG